jgi:heat shock protein HtpX
MASFDALIGENKRNTVILVAGVTLVFCLLAAVIGLVVCGYEYHAAQAPVVEEQYGHPLDMSRGYEGPSFAFALAISIGTAVAVAAIMTIFSYFGGAAALMAVSHAREIQKSDDPQLWNVIEELSLAAGIPMPRVYLIDEPAMNAFATGRDPQHAAVAITAGLRQKLTRDELQGVMAHELSHVRNYDIRLTMFTAVMAGVVVLMADLFMRYLWFGGGRRNSESKGSNPLQLILLIFAIVLAILAPIFIKIIQLAISRQREYMADAAGVALTRYPEGLISALRKLETDEEPLHAVTRATAHLFIVNPLKEEDQRSHLKASNLFQTHPDLEDRIARLQSIGTAAAPGK